MGVDARVAYVGEGDYRSLVNICSKFVLVSKTGG